MNLGVIFDLKLNKPIAAVLHDSTTSNVGYSTYNKDVSLIIDNIIKQDIYLQTGLDNEIKYILCEKNNPYYLSALNNYLPYNYKILWIKNVNGDMNKILDESYDIL